MRYLILGVLAIYALSASAQLYRWTDSSGRIHYTDTPPPPTATNVEQKASSVADSGPSEPFILQQARRGFPVRLYSAQNCEPCASARELLNIRGVPFSEVSVTSDPKHLEELQKTTGVTGVPALVVGKHAQSGFEAGIYHRMLDEAGYPKTGMLPPRNQAEPQAAKKAEPGAVQGEEPPLGPYAPGARRR